MENLIELNEVELIEIEGGIDAEQWGYMCGHALGNTIQQCGALFGIIAMFA